MTTAVPPQRCLKCEGPARVFHRDPAVWVQCADVRCGFEREIEP